MISRQYFQMQFLLFLKVKANGPLFFFLFFTSQSTILIMSGSVFLGCISTKQRIKCLAQEHNTDLLLMLEPKTPLPQDKHCTTEPPRSSNNGSLIFYHFSWPMMLNKCFHLKRSQIKRMLLPTRWIWYMKKV